MGNIISSNGRAIWAFVLALSVLSSIASGQSIDDYNKALITNGVAWSGKPSAYLPSFYTGFAPRIDDANKIHFRLSRGNQIRLTAPLDENTVLSYLYHLKSREAYIDHALQSGVIKLYHQDQFSLFKTVLNAPENGIPNRIQQMESRVLSTDEFYAYSLETLKKLNPGRVFQIQLNLTNSFYRWREQLITTVNGDVSGYATKNPQNTVLLINELLPGRVNLFVLTSELINKLAEVHSVASQSHVFAQKTLELFHMATENRYYFKVFRNGKLQPSLYMTAANEVILEYPEFTAIYPNGSVKNYQKDRDGNQIPIIQENGVMNFIDRSYHDVDHIRSEPFYGYLPKMDYTQSGNGIHNPAVRTSLKRSFYSSLYNDLQIPKNYDTLWVVSRGGVSHGCTRMAAGHILEVRNIFPASPVELKKVKYFGSASTDYDLFDINGDSKPEIMGVKYFLAYAIAADSGEGYREGAGLIEQSLDRDRFYHFLYGKNQFRTESGKYIFINPYISHFLKAQPSNTRGKAFSIQVRGEYELYEQDYEKDKMQFFAMSNEQMRSLSQSNDHQSLGKQLIRSFGRATSCGPLKDSYRFCHDKGFMDEMTQLFPQLTRVK